MDIFRMDAFSGCGFFSVVVTNSGSAGTVGKELAFLFYFGIVPVVVEWSVIWVIAGYRKYKK